MTWKWDQSAGELSHNGVVIARGYSGKGAAKNDPAMEHVRATGPIPRGRWKIGAPWTSSRTGPYVMSLSPIGHDARGRSAFQIHGDSTRAPGTASSGCIILARPVRERIWKSGDHELEVVA
jgi:hypothetical protein